MHTTIEGIAPRNEPAEPFPVLRRFMRRGAPVANADSERCELCSLALSAVHRHLFETTDRRVVCACDPCALRFQNVIDGRFKLIPRDVRALAGFTLAEEEWAELALPIGLAFIVHDSDREGPSAYYPSAAGVTLSLLSLDAWITIWERNPVVRGMQPDVEALLVNRLREPARYFLAPIDVCFELSGILRTSWRGFSGGDLVWTRIDEYFDRLQKRAV